MFDRTNKTNKLANNMTDMKENTDCPKLDTIFVNRLLGEECLAHCDVTVGHFDKKVVSLQLRFEHTHDSQVETLYIGLRHK